MTGAQMFFSVGLPLLVLAIALPAWCWLNRPAAQRRRALSQGDRWTS